MEADYQATIAQAFVQFLEKGYVYRGLKPVHYCISCKTALAEAEVEYEERRSPSIYVKYALLDDPAQLDPALKGRKVSVLIWTTTPWTLPASMAVAFHPKFTYLAVANGEGDVLLVESRRHRAVQEASGLAMPDILARISGKKFDRVRFQHLSWNARFRVSWPPMLPRPTAPGASTLLRVMAARTLKPALSMALKSTVPSDAQASSSKGSRNIPARWSSTPTNDYQAPGGPWCPARVGGEARPFLSPLLALPQPRNFPCQPSVVHLGRPRRAAAEGAG